MKTILISGGAGYLGTELTQYLLKKNFKIVVYDELFFPWLKKNYNKIKNKKNLFFIKKNIRDISVNDFIDVDIVCDLNGIPNDPASEINPKLTWKVNYEGRKKFANFAKRAGVKRYIFNSTCSVYGFNKKKVNEKSKLNPISTYAKANLKSEKTVYSLKDKNFKVNILRNSTLFGFSNTMRLDLVINIFVYNLINKQKIKVDGDGLQFRPFICLLDICRIYEKIIKEKNLKSYICNLVHFNLTIRELSLKICKILKLNKHYISFNSKSTDKRNYNVNSIYFKKLFPNFKFSSLNNEIKKLKSGLKKNKIKVSDQTIRMNFYKKLF